MDTTSFSNTRIGGGQGGVDMAWFGFLDRFSSCVVHNGDILLCLLFYHLVVIPSRRKGYLKVLQMYHTRIKLCSLTCLMLGRYKVHFSKYFNPESLAAICVLVGWLSTLFQ